MCIACEMEMWIALDRSRRPAQPMHRGKILTHRFVCDMPDAEPPKTGPDERQAVSELTSLTLAHARRRFEEKILYSAVELADAHLLAIERARPLECLCATVAETPERANAMAKASDARIAAGNAGPLEGIPLAIKDMFCTEGVRTSAMLAYSQYLRADL